MNTSSFIGLLFILSLSACARPTVWQLYFMGGQSNMDGFGKNEDLTDSLRGELKNVEIFHGNTAPDRVPPDGRGIWSVMREGHGFEFRSDGRTNEYSNRFGPELMFAHRMKELNPAQHIAIIKYVRGGTSIDPRAALSFGCWDPDFDGINQFKHFLATVHHAMAVKDIDGDGVKDRLIPAGILWMQGEADALENEDVAKRYEENLRNLMTQIRSVFGSKDLPVVIGQITDSERDSDGKVWDYASVVRSAQEAYVRHDRHSALVTATNHFLYSDPWHYDSRGFLELGKEFAEEIQKLANGR